jgi:hypothetical protein
MSISEMPDRCAPIRLSTDSQLYREVERMTYAEPRFDHSLSFHPTEGGPTIGRGVYIKKTLGTGHASAVFVPDSEEATE